MKIFFLTILAFNLLFCSSCKKDWLEMKPEKNLNTPSTLNDYEALMDNEVLTSSGYSIGEIGSDGHYMTEANWIRPIGDQTINAYTWSYNRPYNNISSWNLPYQCILLTNITLEGLSKISTVTSADRVRWNRTKGSALFQRARFHFELSQIYAPVYMKASAENTTGMPLRLTTNINIKPVKSSVKEIYDNILIDLQEASKLLPAQSQYRTRASRHAVFALMANVYLTMQEYSSALKYADSCLNIDKTLMDYNTLSAAKTNIGIFNPEVICHSTASGDPGVLTQLISIDRSLYDSYSNDDLRKTRFFNLNNTTGNVTFKGSYNNTNILFMGLAVDEMYLLRAECYARIGNKSAAMKDLNDLLKTRWLKISGISTYIDMTAADANDALNKILVEREKELILRGKRWSDLRRLNLEPNLKITLQRTIGGQTYTLEPNSYKYTFPIPTDEIQLSGLPQNTGWTK